MAARVSRQHRQPCRICRSAFGLVRYRCRMLRTLFRKTGNATCATWKHHPMSILSALNMLQLGYAYSASSLARCPCQQCAECWRCPSHMRYLSSSALPQLASHGIPHAHTRRRYKRGQWVQELYWRCTCRRQPCGAEASAPRLHSTYSLRRHNCEKRMSPGKPGCTGSGCRPVPWSTMSTRRSTHSSGV